MALFSLAGRQRRSTGANVDGGNTMINMAQVLELQPLGGDVRLEGSQEAGLWPAPSEGPCMFAFFGHIQAQLLTSILSLGSKFAPSIGGGEHTQPTLRRNHRHNCPNPIAAAKPREPRHAQGNFI